MKPFFMGKMLMFYYQKNIGDYAKKTGHLTTLEHGVYNLLIDGYYDRERGPTLLEATRWARARSEEEKSAVLAILDEFFVLEGEHYTHPHIIEELVSYKLKAVIAQENGKKGGRPPKNNPEKPSGLSVGTQQEPSPNPEITGLQPNQEPLTNNHKPEAIKVKPTVPPSGATGEVFAYWQQVLNHPTAKLDAKRSKAIKGRLADGYSVADLCQAIDGCKADPFSQGQNDRNTVFDDIELICRDGPKVDKFRMIAERGPVRQQLSKAGQVTANNAQAWLERQQNG